MPEVADKRTLSSETTRGCFEHAANTLLDYLWLGVQNRWIEVALQCDGVTGSCLLYTSPSPRD